MTAPTPEQLADIHERGYRDGLNGLPLPAIAEHFIEAYAAGRRIGTRRSGRLPPPKPDMLSEYSRAVLARPIFADRPVEPAADLPARVGGEVGAPSTLEAA